MDNTTQLDKMQRELEELEEKDTLYNDKLYATRDKIRELTHKIRIEKYKVMGKSLLGKYFRFNEGYGFDSYKKVIEVTEDNYVHTIGIEFSTDRLAIIKEYIHRLEFFTDEISEDEFNEMYDFVANKLKLLAKGE